MNSPRFIPACVVALLLVLHGSGDAQQADATEAIRKNLLFATVGIDGHGEHSLVLDTGASATAILNERLGRKLQLPASRTVTLGGAGSNDCKAAATAPMLLTVSRRKLQPVELDMIDLSGIERFVGRPIEGIIGGSLFNNYAVALDFTTSRAVALADGDRDYIGFTAIPLSSGTGLCCFVELHLSIASRDLRGRFLIDTGAPSIDIALAPRFVQEHNLPPAATAKTVALPALCATSSLLSYPHTADVRIGNFRLRQVNVLLSLDRAGAFADGAFDGIVGGSFLRRFGELVLDVPKARLLVKSPAAGRSSARE